MNDPFLGRRGRTIALLVGALLVRLFFVFEFPNKGDDSIIYEAFAQNLIHAHVYSHLQPENGQLPEPTLIRTPGYPIFLASIFLVAGEHNESAVRVVQAVLDTLTCWIVALIVLELTRGDPKQCQRHAQWALGLAAFCPFLANYSASILAEAPTTFLLTLALYTGVKGITRDEKRFWFLCGLLTGAATLFRPESPLLFLAFVPFWIRQIRKQRTFRPVARSGFLLTIGLLLLLLPWTIRNLVAFHTFQPLAPANAADPNEFVPNGYYRWCKTWLWKFNGVEGYIWPINESAISFDALPHRAFGNEQEHQEVSELFAQYNSTFVLTPSMDARFAALAQEQVHDHPIRCGLALPLLRGLAMWFTPRREILPLEGKVWPIAAAWENDPRDFLFTLFLFLIGLGYAMLALCGVWRLRHQPTALWLLLALLIFRTLFLSYFVFPEPRYVLEAYPATIILAAFAI